MNLNFPLLARSEAQTDYKRYADAESFFRDLCDDQCELRYAEGYFKVYTARRTSAWSLELTEEAAWKDAAEKLCGFKAIIYDDESSLREIIESTEREGGDAKMWRDDLKMLMGDGNA